MNSIRIHASMLLAAVVFGLAVEHASSQPAENKKFAQEFHHDFRGKPLPPELHVVGKPEPAFIKEAPEGFRITLPKKWIHEFGGVGLRSNFKISGDFEITVALEILHADLPNKGYGVGAILRAQLVAPNTHGATIARVARAGGNQKVIWDRGPDPNNKTIEGRADCPEKLLRLRLKREGTTLRYQWASGLEDIAFAEIRADPTFGDDDINAIRLAAVTGREPCDVDVRFIDLRVGSGGLVDGDARPVAPAPNDLAPNPAADSSSGTKLAVILGGGLGLTVVLLAIGVFFFMKRRTPGDGPMDIETAIASFPCPECGKNIQAKPALAGKKVKCPKCGNAVLVPGAEMLRRAD